MKNSRKKKALLLSALASLVILTGCGESKSEKIITIEGEEYIQSGEEYIKLNGETKVFEPGTHITYYVFYSNGCGNVSSGFGESYFEIPETPAGYSIISISDLNHGDDHTNGIVIFYVNNKKVEVQGEYNSSTGLFEYDKPGMVIEEKTLEMGD